MAKFPRAQRHRPVRLRDVRDVRRAAELRQAATRDEVRRLVHHQAR